ncbi:hypothetical protein GF340_03215 [Candidatus Peregrinibacteria bacterium]|nr:hypothetical protein [Candidatus Peregrinibacteria bacterium]
MAFEFKFPDVGEGIHEGKIVKWLVKEGDEIKADDSIAEVETDKAVVEIPSPVTGKIVKITHSEGDTINVGEILATIETADQPTKEEESSDNSTGVVGQIEEATGGIMQAPVLNMSGAVFDNAEALAAPATPIAAAEPVKNESENGGGGGHNVVDKSFKAVKKYDMFGYIDRIPYNGMRKTIGENMAASVREIPHVTHTDITDVTALVEIRAAKKAEAEKAGVHLTFLPYIIKAIIAALQKYPVLASHLDEEEGQIIVKKYMNIGLAVDTEAGLMVPVIKGADRKDLFKIAGEITELAEKARDRKLNAMDMKGGSFTLTNVGSTRSGWFFTPVIAPGQSAILGTGNIIDMPMVIDGEIKARKALPLSLSFDHRVCDGAMAALFTKEIKDQLENPTGLE